jgi:hypothetical protein
VKLANAAQTRASYMYGRYQRRGSAVMTGRPCNPDSDLKGLWRTLLGTPFPACGISEDSDAQDDGAEVEQSAKNSVEPNAEAGASST